MYKYFFILIYLISFSYSYADNKNKIIENLRNTENLNFKFEQNINGKIENGNCTIQYPKKIYCKYIKNNKILVSNGKSLVIKTKTSFYRYPLNKTSLGLILDKKYLIKKIDNLKEKILDKTHISFEIEENENEINLLFDNKTFNLIGWQTKDIYQNVNITYLTSIQINQNVDKNLFKLPIQN
ncbi:outer-membrane lipoprotein carrier protein LolA [Pelagibacteraceae bacterium]|nr:outer-membrane lipoprotein carrier protein LolA [Candidatus Pelagibacter sp.]MDC1490659.1 outer-membrane lipoprotein carrier protein LolA [Pelagibacteraceae bacterium]